MSGEPPLGLADLDEIDVQRLRGVGERKRDALAELGIATVFDLLTHYPRRYVDRTREARIADLVVGDEAMVVAEITRVDGRRTRRGKSLVQVELRDDTGRMRATFFNQPWRTRQLSPGMTAAFFGTVDSYQGRRQMTAPVVDLIGDRTGRIVPVYPQSQKAGLMTWEIAGFVAEALRRCRPRGVADPLPEPVRADLDVVDRLTALVDIHTPESLIAVRAARDRLVFDELLRVQLTLLRRKRELESSAVGVAHRVSGPLIEQFAARVPFALTDAQRRAIAEIERDLEAPTPMHRLLQGDVGAGKTLVAVHAVLVAVQGGHQGVVMAPTEVLAEQHHASIGELVDGLEVPDDATLVGSRPLSVELLTNRVPAARRRQVLAGLAEGSIDIAVGTHALIQDAVEFRSLGVAVVDEQHRFGVEQRSQLREEGRADGAVPDLLVMTATPIPRTAAMTVYGDLDMSVLDELPPGRMPIETRWVRDLEAVASTWADVRDEVGRGRQAYVVCPLIEESDKLDATSAEETFDELAAGELEGLRLGLLHGRLSPADREMTMSLFRSGSLDVLVSTTVIEVGVDVANATAMVILSADRFGIAQLHQLRGRVGRGEHPSMCRLVATDEVTPEAQARLLALEESTDGFELAEVDLDLRGEGTIFDQHQSGRSDLKLASLRRDRAWVRRARDVAASILDADPELAAHDELRHEIEWFERSREEGAAFLLRG